MPTRFGRPRADHEGEAMVQRVVALICAGEAGGDLCSP